MSKIPQEAIEAACRATVLGVNEDDNPVHLSKREALVAIKAALPFLTAPPAPQPTEREKVLEDALKNMMGIYDTPLSRLRFPPDEFMQEVLKKVRAALAGGEA